MSLYLIKDGQKIYENSQDLAERCKVLQIDGEYTITYNFGATNSACISCLCFYKINDKFVITNYLDINPWFFLFFGLLGEQMRVHLNV